MKNTNFAVGGYWHCDKCGEEYHSSRHHTCEPPVTARPDEGDRKDAFTEQLESDLDDFMFSLRPSISRERRARDAYASLKIDHKYYKSQLATSDLAIAEAYRCGYESGKSEVEALRQLVAFYQGEGAHDIPEEAEYRELASIDPNSRSEKQTERLRELANVLRDNFDIESLQSQLAAERTRREEAEAIRKDANAQPMSNSTKAGKRRKNTLTNS